MERVVLGLDEVFDLVEQKAAFDLLLFFCEVGLEHIDFSDLLERFRLQVGLVSEAELGVFW